MHVYVETRHALSTFAFKGSNCEWWIKKLWQ